MWSRVGTLHLAKGQNRLCITDLKPDARIHHIYLGTWPPFPKEPRLRIPAKNYLQKHNYTEGNIVCVEQLGYTDGMTVLPFNTPSYALAEASYLDYVVTCNRETAR